MIKGRCEDCTHSVLTPREALECRQLSPTVHVDGCAQWPMVRSDDVCSMFSLPLAAWSKTPVGEAS